MRRKTKKTLYCSLISGCPKKGKCTKRGSAQYLLDAMNFMINGWDELQRYRHDGHLTIDNMVAERAIRPFTVWRKNIVLFGSEDGVETTAAYFSVIETLRLCGVNIKDYLVDVFRAAIAGIKDYEAFDPAVYALKPAV